MNTELQVKINLLRKRHATTVACFLAEGYQERFTAHGNQFSRFSALFHSENGNRITVTTSFTKQIIRKNSEFIKETTYE